MKPIIQRILMSIIMLCLSFSAFALDIFTVDGISYLVTSEFDMTCEVVKGNNEYVGEIEIPSTVTNNHNQYSVTKIGNDAFSYCHELTSVTIGNSVTSIGDNAFFNSENITTVIMPDSVTEIGFQAFSGCASLTSIIIPDAVTEIGMQAFSYCVNLTSIFYNCENPIEINYLIFDATTLENATLYVPEEAVVKCKVLSPWKDFKNIRAYDFSRIVAVSGEGEKTVADSFDTNRLHQAPRDIFNQDVISIEDQSLVQVLGDLLRERELTVACAESCTGGNIAHRITQQPGCSNYFLGGIVSYANDVKTNVLGVPQKYIDQYGAVSRDVVESMAEGACRLMRSDCSISTSGIAGPDGGTKYKPVGTVWIGVKYGSKIVSECRHFKGDRNAVIEQATAHGIVMLIKMLRDEYEEEDDLADE